MDWILPTDLAIPALACSEPDLSSARASGWDLTSRVTDWIGESRDFWWCSRECSLPSWPDCSPGSRRRLTDRFLRSDWQRSPPAWRPALPRQMRWRPLSRRWQHSPTRHAPAWRFSCRHVPSFLPRLESQSARASVLRLAQRSDLASGMACQRDLRAASCPAFRWHIRREESAIARARQRAAGLIADRFA